MTAAPDQPPKKRRKAARKKGLTPPGSRLRVLTRLRNYFFAGVLITAPISITIWVTWNLVSWIDDRVTPLIPPAWNPETYLPFTLPGLGLIIIFLVLTFVGFAFAGFIGRAVMGYGERLLARVPVVRSLYGATKQIFETVLAQKSTAFRQVALVEYPIRGTWAIGFLTGQTVGEVQRKTEATVYNVFIPATPNPTTGFLIFVPERDIHLMDMTVEEGIKLVVSGGIVTPPKGQAIKPDAALAAEGLKQGAQTTESAPPKAGMATRLRNYFLAGVLVTAPIFITVWLVWKFVTFIDNRVTPLLPLGWRPESLLPVDVPGFGLLVALVGLTLIGMLTAGFTGRLITRTGEQILNRVPFVRSLYATIKQIFEAVLKQRSNAFREVVLFQYPREDVWAIGFLTGKTEEHIQEITENEVINVFLATTPNPTSGFLLFVPRKQAIKLSMTVEEGLKMVVSGGIVTPPDRGKSAAKPAKPKAAPAKPMKAAAEGD